MKFHKPKISDVPTAPPATAPQPCPATAPDTGMPCHLNAGHADRHRHNHPEGWHLTWPNPAPDPLTRQPCGHLTAEIAGSGTTHHCAGCEREARLTERLSADLRETADRLHLAEAGAAALRSSIRIFDYCDCDWYDEHADIPEHEPDCQTVLVKQALIPTAGKALLDRLESLRRTLLRALGKPADDTTPLEALVSVAAGMIESTIKSLARLRVVEAELAALKGPPPLLPQTWCTICGASITAIAGPGIHCQDCKDILGTAPAPTLRCTRCHVGTLEAQDGGATCRAHRCGVWHPTQLLRDLLRKAVAAKPSGGAVACGDELPELSTPVSPAAHYLLQAETASLRHVLETEVMPRYVELFEAAGLGRPEASVAVVMAEVALSGTAGRELLERLAKAEEAREKLYNTAQRLGVHLDEAVEKRHQAEQKREDAEASMLELEARLVKAEEATRAAQAHAASLAAALSSLADVVERTDDPSWYGEIPPACEMAAAAVVARAALAAYREARGERAAPAADEGIAQLRAELRQAQQKADTVDAELWTLVDERDSLTAIINATVEALGLECEWSSEHTHGRCIVEAIDLLQQRQAAAHAEIARIRPSCPLEPQPAPTIPGFTTHIGARPVPAGHCPACLRPEGRCLPGCQGPMDGDLDAATPAKAPQEGAADGS